MRQASQYQGWIVESAVYLTYYRVAANMIYRHVGGELFSKSERL